MDRESKSFYHVFCTGIDEISEVFWEAWEVARLLIEIDSSSSIQYPLR